MIARVAFKALLAAQSALACGAAFAQSPQGLPRDHLLVHTETSRLDNGQPDWQEQSVGWRRQWTARHWLQAGVGTTRRFGLEDQRVSLGYAQPLSVPLALELEAAYSPTHRVLAQATAGARLAWQFEPRWLLHTSLRGSRHDDGTVRQGSLGLEHYFGRYSAAVTGQVTQALGTEVTGTQLRLNVYYGERNAIGLLVAQGREAVRLGPGSLRIARVQTVATLGRHALNGPWTLAWSLERSRQGDFYTRTGASLGVDYAF